MSKRQLARGKAKDFIAGNLAKTPRPSFDWDSVNPKTVVETPGLLTLARRFREAMFAWRQAGYPVVGWKILSKRWATCRACPLWNGWQCTHESCGCTGFKLVLATEKCPIDKWKAEVEETP